MSARKREKLLAILDEMQRLVSANVFLTDKDKEVISSKIGELKDLYKDAKFVKFDEGLQKVFTSVVNYWENKLKPALEASSEDQIIEVLRDVMPQKQIPRMEKEVRKNPRGVIRRLCDSFLRYLRAAYYDFTGKREELNRLFSLTTLFGILFFLGLPASGFYDTPSFLMALIFVLPFFAGRSAMRQRSKMGWLIMAMMDIMGVVAGAMVLRNVIYSDIVVQTIRHLSAGDVSLGVVIGLIMLTAGGMLFFVSLFYGYTLWKYRDAFV